MSKSSKKRFVYFLVITSISLNLMLMVNVFALKKVTTVYKDRLPEQDAPLVGHSPSQEKTLSEKSLINTTCEMARSYEIKGDNAKNMQEKTDYYSLSMLEYAKLPKNNPKYACMIRQAKEKMLPIMLKDSSFNVAMGESRQQVEQVYGKAEQEIADLKYLPTGIITYLHYPKQGLVVGISNNRVFSVKFCSNFTGSWYGIRISDRADKIKNLYPGKILSMAGKNFDYKVDNLKTTFTFVDPDENLDAITVFDTQYYGNWDVSMK